MTDDRRVVTVEFFREYAEGRALELWLNDRRYR